MTNLPEWIQQAKDRADKATPGPWFIGLGSGNHLCTGVFSDTEVPLWITDCLSDSMLQSMRTGSATLPRDHAPNMEFIAHARTDVPRLIELAGEMAERLEGAVAVLDDIAAYGYDVSRVQDIVREVSLGQGVLAKYRGEAER